jgi:hypothetical protein
MSAWVISTTARSSWDLADRNVSWMTLIADAVRPVHGPERHLGPAEADVLREPEAGL